MDRFPTIQYPATVEPIFTGGETINADKWIFQWSEPVRSKPNPASLKAPVWTGVISPIIPAFWFKDWEGPVRFRPGLKAHYQQYTSLPTPFQPPVNTFMAWYSPLGDPVRLRPGLKAPWQKEFFGPPRLLPTPNVTVTMAATETDLDAFLAALNVYNSATPTTSGPGARVSITEIQVPAYGATSLREL